MIISNKQDIVVNVNPTYICNKSCQYCYLGTLRKDSTILSLDVLNKQLQTLNTLFNITHIDYYGGEVSLLDNDYLKKSYDIMKKYTSSISTVINGSLYNDIIDKESPIIAISFNNKLDNDISLWNHRPINLLSLYINDEWSPKEFLNKVSLTKAKSVRIIELCSSITNDNINIDKNYNDKFENFVYNCIKEYMSNDYTFILENLEQIKQQQMSPPSCFITPKGDLSILLQNNGREYFKIVSNDELLHHINTIKKYYENSCLTCEYYNRCLFEHFTYKCCGHKQLIQKVENECLR